MTEVPPWAPREFYNPRYNPRNGWDRCNSGLRCLAFPRVGLGVNPVPGNAPTRISQKLAEFPPILTGIGLSRIFVQNPSPR